MKYILTVLLTATLFVSHGQNSSSNTKTESDTLLSKLLKDIPKKEQAEFLEEYKKMSSDQKMQMLELMNFFSSMPQSSKKQLIQNIDTNYNNIVLLKNFFNKIVPSKFSIYIEFKPPETILKLDESVDFWISKKNNNDNPSELVFQVWNVELKSEKLDSLLRLTPLSRNDLQRLKGYLDKANSISIANGDVCEIGYARSGMGKYSYLIFDKALNDEEKKQYNNGCTYIYYKDNIVLEYGGGAIGSQCFPDK